jgi:proline dehydrogenase
VVAAAADLTEAVVQTVQTVVQAVVVVLGRQVRAVQVAKVLPAVRGLLKRAVVAAETHQQVQLV